MSFVRVKRRHNEDPFNSIVVSHKKLKTIGTEFRRDCVFQFAATLKDENENLSQILKEVREESSVKELTKKNKNKNINDVVEHSKAERLKLVNTLRAVKQDTVPIEEIDGKNSEIKVVDFVKQVEENGKPLIDEGISIDYVYDLYYASNNDNKSIDIQDIDSVHGLDSDNFYNICRNIDSSDNDSSHCEDDDDSNDEGNWRNDYPDEDEMDNDENDYCQNLVSKSKQWNINDESSSDTDENIEDYDLRFARYKERVKAEEHFFYNSVDESSGSTNDSDD
ncbi:probable RNA polymerase II nuclear localization protein SLC7A6OS [Metopolophium dirhodum]|uniref:probable RNA polymerase II nuclear localization protein SLC7A6OS n=1 Tax=Metopolophium dirhodum TaxID=44670 RepID=UPI00298FEAAF|nr:probable RNA polymerase II nuclear localization protein SLC7A6OS [Metopolophium dirhodum]